MARSATLPSALREVDSAGPLQSKILHKPLGDLPHGGGRNQEKVQYGDDEMPAFPALDAGDVSAIVTYVHGAFCAED